MPFDEPICPTCCHLASHCMCHMEGEARASRAPEGHVPPDPAFMKAIRDGVPLEVLREKRVR